MSQRINLVVLGHVDHGKSTLIGRLLYNTGHWAKEKIEEVRQTAEKLGKEMEFAFFMDNLEEERENAMTIDIIQTRFDTKKRNYLIIDCPGHKELVKNMVSGASHAQSAVIVISAQSDEGIQEQTRRHIFLAKMLGIEQLFIAVNKMDAVEYKPERFEQLKQDILPFLLRLGYQQENVFFLPVSAKLGENISHKSEKMEWYGGQSLIDTLDEKIMIPADGSEKLFRASVQDVYIIEGQEVIIAKIESGKIKEGEEVLCNLSEQKGTIKEIKVFGEERAYAVAGESVGFNIEGIDYSEIERGEVISREHIAKQIEIAARIFVLYDTAVSTADAVKIQVGTAEREAKIVQIVKKFDSATMDELKNEAGISSTEAADIICKLELPFIAEKFSEVPSLGRFLLMKDHKIAAIGIVTDYLLG